MKIKTPLVSVIIANWNGGDVFKNCLASLSKIDYPNWELIVVDNGSTDGSENVAANYQLIKNKNLPSAEPCSLVILKNKTNLGFAKANNQGYEKAWGKYILLLNNDTKVERDFLLKLVERMERDPSIGVIQPKIYLMDKPGFLDNVGTYLTWTGFLENWGFMQKDRPEFTKEREIFSAKGACMLIKREVVEKVGLFDPDFFSYFEESDFCWRVWLSDYRVLFYPNTIIYHKLGFTSKRQSQIFVNYHAFKNRLSSLIKNLEFKNLILILGLHMVLILGLAIYFLIRLQHTKSFMIMRAILWNVWNINLILAKRARVQKLRRKRDNEIFTIVMRKINWQEMFAHFGRVEANFR